jgi:nucleoid DNA-binding protein
MTKKDMARIITEETGLRYSRVLEIVQQIFDGIIDTLVQEGRIELRNFGIFEVKKRKARQARNPRTGESVSVPEKLGVTFKPGLEMRERVRQAGGPSQQEAALNDSLSPSNSKDSRRNQP